jgi:hypothetical protein
MLNCATVGGHSAGTANHGLRRFNGSIGPRSSAGFKLETFVATIRVPVTLVESSTFLHATRLQIAHCSERNTTAALRVLLLLASGAG